MEIITEDYVSFETAKLLKEKGFEEVCMAYYEDFGTRQSLYISDKRGAFNIVFKQREDLSNRFNLPKDRYKCSAPTIQMAMKWLREIHKISIEITSTGYLIDNDVEWECDIKAGRRLYFRHITNEKSFESCAEAAIKYCLENLI